MLKNLTIIMFWVLLSCCEGSNEFERFIGQKVVIPFEKMSMITNDVIDINNYAYKHIIYIDSTQCVKCIENKFALWISFAQKAKKENPNYQMFFIVDGEKRIAEKIKELTYYSDYNPVILYDSLGLVKKNNENIGNSAVYNSFIIDSEKKVKLLGDPINGAEIENIMLKFLKKEQ